MDPHWMVLRLGYYTGLAWRELGDISYTERFLGHPDEITEAVYEQVSEEIKARLLNAGKKPPYKDPYENHR